MITADVTKAQKQLQEYNLVVRRKLKHMVVNFARQIAAYAIDKTPLGDSETYAKMYSTRTFLPKVEGLARGNWQFSPTTSASLQLIAGRQSGDSALDIIEQKSQGYKLGDTFYIINTAPYITALEGNHSPQTLGEGIMRPTMQMITASYKIDLKLFYDQG